MWMLYFNGADRSHRCCLQVTLVIKFLRPRRPRLPRWGLKNDGAAEIPLPFSSLLQAFWDAWSGEQDQFIVKFNTFPSL